MEIWGVFKSREYCASAITTAKGFTEDFLVIPLLLTMFWSETFKLRGFSL
jgi:hypothetical protein